MRAEYFCLKLSDKDAGHCGHFPYFTSVCPKPGRKPSGPLLYFVVCAKNGQGLPYVHFEDDPGRRTAADLLTKDEARRIAANFA